MDDCVCKGIVLGIVCLSVLLRLGTIVQYVRFQTRLHGICIGLEHRINGHGDMQPRSYELLALNYSARAAHLGAYDTLLCISYGSSSVVPSCETPCKENLKRTAKRS